MPSDIRVIDDELRLIPRYPAKYLKIMRYGDPDISLRATGKAEPYTRENKRAH